MNLTTKSKVVDRSIVKDYIANGSITKTNTISTVRNVKVLPKPKKPRVHIVIGCTFYGKKVIEKLLDKGILEPELINYIAGDSNRDGILHKIAKDFEIWTANHLVYGQTVQDHLDRLNAITREFHQPVKAKVVDVLEDNNSLIDRVLNRN